MISDLPGPKRLSVGSRSVFSVALFWMIWHEIHAPAASPPKAEPPGAAIFFEIRLAKRNFKTIPRFLSPKDHRGTEGSRCFNLSN